MEKHCDIARMDETFYPSQYACGAQKNSAYTAPVSDVCVSLVFLYLLTTSVKVTSLNATDSL